MFCFINLWATGAQFRCFSVLYSVKHDFCFSHVTLFLVFVIPCLVIFSHEWRLKRRLKYKRTSKDNGAKRLTMQTVSSNHRPNNRNCRRRRIALLTGDISVFVHLPGGNHLGSCHTAQCYSFLFFVDGSAKLVTAPFFSTKVADVVEWGRP